MGQTGMRRRLVSRLVGAARGDFKADICPGSAAAPLTGRMLVPVRLQPGPGPAPAPSHSGAGKDEPAAGPACASKKACRSCPLARSIARWRSTVATELPAWARV